MRRHLHYGWVIFGLSFLNLVTEGGLKNTVPVLYVALRDSFHWSAAVTSSVFSLAGLVGALGAPLLGRLLDRWGPRYLFPVGGLLIGLGWCASSFVTDLWPLLLFYSVVATVGENSISSFTTAATLAPWFPRTRGWILGLADAGNPLGAVLFLPLAQWLISTIGWRVTFRVLGIVFFLMVGPANLLLQRRPPLSRAVPDPGGAAVSHAPLSTPPVSPGAAPPTHPSGRNAAPAARLSAGLHPRPRARRETRGNRGHCLKCRGHPGRNASKTT